MSGHVDGVNDEGGASGSLAAGIARIYAGPLEGFVVRRVALVKALRAAGRREDAATVKALRKPSRVAWALDAASLADPESIEHVAAAIDATLAAQSGGRDLRTALSELREAVQKLADTASRTAASGGYSVDRAELVNAVMAVIGAPGAFELLRAGLLVDVPEAGGLAFLAAPSRSDSGPSPVSVESRAGGAEVETVPRKALRTAEIALAAARKRSASAERALRDAEAGAVSAERKLVLAQEEALARQTERDRARREARDAAAQLREAEKSVATARG